MQLKVATVSEHSALSHPVNVRRATERLSSLSDWASYPLVRLAAERYAGLLGTPEHFVKMLLLIEDKRFLVHPGVDPIAVVRALAFNTRRGALQGASTVIQQLYNIRRKDDLTTTHRSVTYKIRQSLWALSCSTMSCKGFLLDQYVGAVYWGRSYYGIDQAAKGYFSTTRSSLDAAQSFFLAERIAMPNSVSPQRISNLIGRRPIRNSLKENNIGIADVAALYQKIYGCGGEAWAILGK